jgi:uncharacterized membrane protein YgdD (TMEM256/DUF423 family)
MRILLVVAALLGAAGVGIGAFAAHGLEKLLSQQGLDEVDIVKRLQQCDVAVRYHMLHTLALVILSLTSIISGRKWRVAVVTAVFWLMGIALFSGGLYSMVFAGVMGHWTIVPSGGLCFIVGWCALAGLAFQPDSNTGTQ